MSEEANISELSGLGRIERSDLRDVWPNEAADFTPWLAEHISELGTALGLDLELQSQEAPVGAFSLDVLARVSGDNRTVVIENQLERTNHDHLGKLLAYAGGLDANLVIWIAKEFREEHRQAIDWLNQRTDTNTEVFGVVVEIWKIDGSRPAPHFNVVAAPNAWHREATAKVRKVNESEKNQRYKTFFQSLIDRLREDGFTNARKGQPQSWYSFSVGYGTRAQLMPTFRQGGVVRIDVYIDSLEKDWNKTLFDHLLARKDSIESALGESLDWLRLEHVRHSRISISRQGSIYDDQDVLKELENWMFERLLDFKRAFGPHLDELAR